MRFIEIKVMNCIDPQNCLINHLDPVPLEQTRPGDAKHKINLILTGVIHPSGAYILNSGKMIIKADI